MSKTITLNHPFYFLNKKAKTNVNFGFLGALILALLIVLAIVFILQINFLTHQKILLKSYENETAKIFSAMEALSMSVSREIVQADDNSLSQFEKIKPNEVKYIMVDNELAKK